MALSKRCEICSKEISEIDRTYFVSFGEKTNIPFTGKVKKGDICYDCVKKIEQTIEDQKKLN